VRGREADRSGISLNWQLAVLFLRPALGQEARDRRILVQQCHDAQHDTA
jgi:hypothetical protein